MDIINKEIIDFDDNEIWREIATNLLDNLRY